MQSSTGDPYRCCAGQQLVDIRRRNFTGSVRESELPIIPIVSQGQHNLEGGKGQCLYHVSEEVKERRIAIMLETPEKIRELQRKLYQKSKQEKAPWTQAKGTGRR
jgi:hypothetical protein